MKKLFLILFIFVNTILNANNDFLSPQEAFKINIFETKENVTINMNIDKTIYLYDDKLKVFVGLNDITKKVLKHKSQDYDGFTVHFGDINILIPKTLIKEINGNKKYTVEVKYQGCSKKGLCYAPMSNKYEGSLNNSTNTSNTNTNATEDVDETTSITNILNDGNIFIILASFFGFGLFLSLTPCIFPMIPILSSIIVQHSNSNNGKISALEGFKLSLVYVLAMSVAYTLAGILAGMFGANIQAMLQNPYVLVGFAGVFVALAFSLFGYYSLELPQSFQNKINNITGNSKKGMASVAIMGFLSALIVGPCVAPPLAGALVYIGQTGDAVLGGLALFVMSLGLGMPLLLIGIGAGKYMPKPGGWMNTVSKIFGVVMLALAIYMLDRLLEQYIIYILFAVLFAGSAIYLLKASGLFAKISAIILLLIASYFGYLSANIQDNHLKFKYVKTVQELDTILANTTKPVMLDYWASWCVSCKELENITFADETVRSFLDGYLLLKVDVTENNKNDQELMKRFNIFGPPALIFFDKNGKEEKSKKIIGYKGPKDFMDIVTK
jgi:thiol:disulfide interchange protein DsbD